MAAFAMTALMFAACDSTPDRSREEVPETGSATTASSQESERGPTDDEATSTTGHPGVVPVRVIHPDEFAAVMASCVTEQGFVATVRRDGGVQFPSVAEEQGPALEAAIDLCGALYPVDTRFTEPLGREQLEFLYGWFVDESVPCLENQGFAGFSPPSLETFIEEFDTEDTWAPYRDIEQQLMVMSETELFDLQEICPQSPPADDLFGS
jgi:hypothetical protein